MDTNHSTLDYLLALLGDLDATGVFTADESARLAYREQWDRICRDNGWEPEEVDIALEARLIEMAE